MIKLKSLMLFILLASLSPKIYGINSNNIFDDILIALKKHKHKTIIKVSIKDTFMIKYIDCQIEKNNTGTIKKAVFDEFLKTNPKNTYQKALRHLNNGDYIFSNNENEVSKYLDEYEQALRIGKEIKSKIIICEALRRFCFHYLNTQKNLKSLGEKVKEYKEYTYDKYEDFYYSYYKTNYNMQNAFINNSNIKVAQLDKLLSKAESINLDIIKGKAYRLKSVYFLMFKNDLDSSTFYIQKSKDAYSEKNTQYKTREIIGLEINKAINLNKKGLYTKSIQLLDSIKKLETSSTNPRYKISTSQFLKEGYFSLKKYDSAYKYLELENRIKEKQNLIEQDVKFAEIEGKYDTSEAEKKVLIEQQKSKQNQNIAIGLGGSLALGSIIAFLIFKNTKRKQKLAEQDKEIETQKLATVLKEQELTAIDAMIEGQEKERQRIANDLHDDLGGLMATVKLHFNALKDKKSPELFDKTNTLIDEAYNKVRSVAHAKNSGVIAKHGLLKSVKEMANKISISNQLEIEVIDYGLETRLENSLELTLFRIIQELISNAVKHAQASEISIHITNHGDMINLMVEDNGKGFNASQITKTNKGMGINSIDKRVEHLDGKMTIESEKNKGTTIIIDIPL